MRPEPKFRFENDPAALSFIASTDKKMKDAIDAAYDASRNDETMEPVTVLGSEMGLSIYLNIWVGELSPDHKRAAGIDEIETSGVSSEVTISPSRNMSDESAEKLADFLATATWRVNRKV